ncbi:hypothetical protein [Fibrobacter succinogenes]|uniref:hypothetical protein n=1 Tax=Fibrobacter succinogenes TaxID=833 RepID=UPI000D6A946A|nr:hypothetical protein [Fibrobacter succinogenes]
MGRADDVKDAFIYNKIAVEEDDDAIFSEIFDIIINPPEEQDELSKYLFSSDLKNSMTELELNWVRNHCDDDVQGDGENVGSFEHVYHKTHAGGHGNSIWWIYQDGIMKVVGCAKHIGTDNNRYSFHAYVTGMSDKYERKKKLIT